MSPSISSAPPATCRAACALILGCFSAAASAQGFFIGAAGGQATQQDYSVGGPIATNDDTDSSYRIYGGYLVSPMQGVVLSYLDLGEAYYDGPAFGGFTDYLSAEGVDVSYIVGWTPGSQQRAALFGTVGIFNWEQKVRYTDTTGTVLYKDEGTSFSLGLGTEINLGANGRSPWGIHVEYQMFKDVGDENNSGHELDREVFSVGVNYRFGRK